MTDLPPLPAPDAAPEIKPDTTSLAAFARIVAFIEAAHGITGETK